MTGYRQKITEFPRYVGGKRVIEIFLEPRKSCRYYWKALITTEHNGRYRVRFLDRFGEPYRESPLFENLDDAKIHVRRTLLNQ